MMKLWSLFLILSKLSSAQKMSICVVEIEVNKKMI